jgi:hypothetical protein
MASSGPSTSARPTWSIFDGFEPPARRASAARPTWSVFDGFERPRQRVSWASLDELVSRAQRYVEERCRAFPELLRRWDKLLEELLGEPESDPSHSDWTTFRPLRNEVACYCGFTDDEDKPIGFEYTRNHPRIEFRKWSRKARLFMLIESGKEIALDEEFKVILDELMGSLK